MYCVRAPDDDVAEGWLELGRPPWPVPGIKETRRLAPRVGQVVFFPSSLWVGAASVPTGKRLLVFFDVRFDGTRSQ